MPAWPKEKITAFFEMLVEEINEKTEFELKLQAWQQCSTKTNRIRVLRKTTEVDKIVRLIQILGASRNKLLKSAKVRATVESLLS
ncbi:MAG: hypothetical protein ABUL66_00470 [Verrucomicrobiota bacterium]